MLISGDAGTSLALDDIARALGYDFATDLQDIINVLGLEEEKSRLRELPRGRIEMITLAAAVKIAEAVESREGRALASFLRTQIPMSEFDRARYNDLPQETIARLRARQSVTRLLANHPEATVEFVAERLGIARDEAAYLLNFSRNLQALESGRAASRGRAIASPVPLRKMND